MRDIGNNQGNGRKCECGKEEEIEHIMECKMIRKRLKDAIKIEDIESEEKRKMER